MMLWYKAWLETRTRFIISLAGIAFFCSYRVSSVLEQKKYSFHPVGYSNVSAYSGALFQGHVLLCTLWVFAMSFLLMGGLLHEKDMEISAFTLSLPVSRVRLMVVRVGAGLLEGVTLGILPWFTMLLVLKFSGWTPPAIQIMSYLTLLIGGGMPFVALAVLISSTVKGLYTAPLVNFAVVIWVMFTSGAEHFRMISPLNFMQGYAYLDHHAWLMLSPFPWLQLALSLAFSVSLIILSIVAIQRRDF
jgi:ABC-2 type transport system permease protein